MCAQKLSHLAYTEQLGDVLMTAEELATRVAELGQMITADYRDRVTADHPLILVGVLKGVVPFFADLMRQIDLPVEVYFLDIASYASDSRENLNLDIDPKLSKAINGRQLLFVEEVIDAGLTLNHLTRLLYIHHPDSLEICAMFDKQTRRIIETEIRYVGYELHDQYVVGYGLDHKELYRNLPFVALLERP